MTTLIRRETKALLYFGSSVTARLSACRRLDINSCLLCWRRGCSCFSCLGPFHAVLRSAHAAFFHSGSIERSTDNMITHPWKVFDTPTPHKNDRVFLQIVPFVRDIRYHFV